MIIFNLMQFNMVNSFISALYCQILCTESQFGYRKSIYYSTRTCQFGRVVNAPYQSWTHDAWQSLTITDNLWEYTLVSPLLNGVKFTIQMRRNNHHNKNKHSSIYCYGIFIFIFVSTLRVPMELNKLFELDEVIY